MAATTVDVREGRVAYKWVALSVTTLGAAMSAIDSSIVILGVPRMMESLHSDLVRMTWVIMGYILMSTVFLGLFGRLADIFGRVRMYNLGFVVFTVGSLLCGLAQSGNMLVGFRLVQGVGGAMLMANSMAILTEAFPASERGRAMGLNSIVWSGGNILGPILGGVILTFATWRWIFLINLPIGIVGTIWGYLALHELSQSDRRARIDLPGTVLLSGGLVCLLVALSQSISWGWSSGRTDGLLAGFVVLVGAFIWRERHTGSPLIDPALFRSRIFSFTIWSATLEALAMFAVNFLVLFYLQGVKGISPLHAAFAILPLPIAQSLCGPLGGSLSDRYGARLPAAVGLGIQALACLVLASLTPTSSAVPLAAGLILLGCGGGLVWSANTSAVMGAAPQARLGIAAATLATFRQCGMVTSFALALAVAAATMSKAVAGKIFLGASTSLGSSVMANFSVGMRHALLVSCAIVLIAALMTIVAGDTISARSVAREEGSHPAA